MKIAIKPISQFVPGKGIMSISTAEVTVANYNLGTGAKCRYQLLATDPQNSKNLLPVPGASGEADLTPAQFEQWGQDDSYVASCVVTNIGLTPA